MCALPVNGNISSQPISGGVTPTDLTPVERATHTVALSSIPQGNDSEQRSLSDRVVATQTDTPQLSEVYRSLPPSVALMVASRDGNLLAVQTLLQNNLNNPDIFEHLFDALIVAGRIGHSEIIILLLKHASEDLQISLLESMYSRIYDEKRNYGVLINQLLDHLKNKVPIKIYFRLMNATMLLDDESFSCNLFDRILHEIPHERSEGFKDSTLEYAIENGHQLVVRHVLKKNISFDSRVNCLSKASKKHPEMESCFFEDLSTDGFVSVLNRVVIRADYPLIKRTLARMSIFCSKNESDNRRFADTCCNCLLLSARSNDIELAKIVLENYEIPLATLYKSIDLAKVYNHDALRELIETKKNAWIAKKTKGLKG